MNWMFSWFQLAFFQLKLDLIGKCHITKTPTLSAWVRIAGECRIGNANVFAVIWENIKCRFIVPGA